MCYGLWLIAVGLFFTLVGIFVTFCVKPPRMEGLDRKRFFKNMVAKHEHLPTPPGPSVEDVERREGLKLKFSFIGVGLLALGTLLQLVGTAWQIVVAACRK